MLEKVAGTVTPQPVLAVVRTPEATIEDLADAQLVIVCVDVRDPGNAGALIRSADASGAGGVVCCDGTVDPFNPKTVRASAGSVLHVPVVTGVGRLGGAFAGSRLGASLSAEPSLRGERRTRRSTGRADRLSSSGTRRRA